MAFAPSRHPFNGLSSSTTWVSRHHKCYDNLGFNEARDDGVAVASAGSLCKSVAPRCRQTTTPAPHHSIFYRPDALSSKNCRQFYTFKWIEIHFEFWQFACTDQYNPTLWSRFLFFAEAAYLTELPIGLDFTTSCSSTRPRTVTC